MGGVQCLLDNPLVLGQQLLLSCLSASSDVFVGLLWLADNVSRHILCPVSCRFHHLVLNDKSHIIIWKLNFEQRATFYISACDEIATIIACTLLLHVNGISNYNVIYKTGDQNFYFGF